MNLKMNCLGWHWNAVDYKYYKTRNDVDNQQVREINSELIEIAKPFSQQFFPYHKADWDVCICNYYDSLSKLGMHKDNSETNKVLEVGHPVVSFSVGASCVFAIGGFTRNDPYKNIKLDSGDVFIFGGESRLRFHGVKSIIKDEKVPFSRWLNNGRINFTLRKL